MPASCVSQVPAGGNASFRSPKGRQQAILGFTRQNRDPHAILRIRGMGYCRIPSLQGTRGVKLVETSGQWCCLLGDLVASDTLFVERLASASLFTPPIPTHTSELLFRGVPLPPARCAPAGTPQPRRYPVDHSIRSMQNRTRVVRWTASSLLPQASRPPDSRGGQVNATPVFEGHKMCRRSRIPMSIANTWGSSTSFAT